MRVLSIETTLKICGLVIAGAFFFSSVAESTVDLPVRKVEPLSGRCVAFLVQSDLLHCEDEAKPDRFRDEVTFPHATFEQLLAIHQQ